MERRGAIAGAGIAVACAAAVMLVSADRSRAAAQSSLTVALPPPVTDTIYGAPQARGRPIVVIDPGHGGEDPGATSISGQVHEKDLTLALGRELRDELVKRGRVRVAMTRDNDRYLTLEDRAALARRLNAAIFVSLHIDSAPNALARGATIYSLSDVASDAEAARLAASENAQDRSEGGQAPVESMLSDLAMQGQMKASAALAERFVNRAHGQFELRPNPHRFASFHVLRRSDVPAVLFEAGYISNADDEILLRTPAERSKIVLALAEAIERDVASRSRR